MLESDKQSSEFKKNRPNPWLNKNFLNILPLNSLPEDYGTSSALTSRAYS